MKVERIPESVALLMEFSSLLWITAVLFFGVGDIVTTHVGLQFQHIVEVGPVAKPVIQKYHVFGMIGLKALVFAVCYAIYKLVPEPHNIGAPLGLAALGILVTGWNLLMMASSNYPTLFP